MIDMRGLILFDIDKTLIKSSKVKDELAFPVAIKKIYGVDIDLNSINTHGMTDQQIIIKILVNKGLPKKEIESKLNECMNLMVKIFKKYLHKDKVIILKGVKLFLKALEKNNYLMGLVTGNLEPIARGKLSKIDIDRYFKVGGFGNEDINRTRLVKLAIKKALREFKFNSKQNIFLFGDAPQDILAARQAKVKAIGVLTGVYTRKELENAGADFIVENLENKKSLFKIIENN